jgi:ElaB/YqjD/DUF883 family membrane-anchored ribosome-binding protein
MIAHVAHCFSYINQPEGTPVETTGTINDFSKQGQDLADRAANKIQGGIRDTKRTVDNAADQLSGQFESMRNDSKPLIKNVTKQANAMAKSVGDATLQFRDAASRASASVISYTKENPTKAILVAAVSGVLLLTLFQTISRSRR